jgi:hypothetical protein
MFKSLSFLAAFAAAATAFTIEVAPGINLSTKTLGDPSLNILDLTNTAGSLNVSQEILDKFSSTTLVKPIAARAKLDSSFTITTDDCIIPNPAANAYDCGGICEYLLGPLTSVTLSPFEILSYSEGTCVFEAINLDPCDEVIVSLNVLGDLCQSMLTGCVYNGYDGVIETASPTMMMILSGIPAAPPYEATSCT